MPRSARAPREKIDEWSARGKETSEQARTTSARNARAGSSLAAANAAKNPAAANRQPEGSSCFPDPEELVEREESTEGRDRVIVQRLRKRQEIGPERRGDQAEQPGPVVRRVAVQHASEETREDPERNDVQEHHDRLEIKNVGWPAHGVLGCFEHAFDPVRRAGVGFLGPSRGALLAARPGRAVRRSRPGPDREARRSRSARVRACSSSSAGPALVPRMSRLAPLGARKILSWVSTCQGHSSIT